MPQVITDTKTTNFNGVSTDTGQHYTDELGHIKLLNDILTGNTLGGSFKVNASNPASMNVVVSQGSCKVPYANYAYDSWMESDNTLTVDTSSQSTNRVSAIVAYINRGKLFGGNVVNNPGLLVITEVHGAETAAAPVAPTDAQIEAAVGVGNPFIRLANVVVNQGASVITNSNITDVRTPLKLNSALL